MNATNQTEKEKDIQVRDWTDKQITEFLTKQGIQTSTLPPTLWTILITIWSAIMIYAGYISSPGLILANVVALIIILVLGYWQTNYPEQIIIECMGRYYRREKAGWGFIIPGFMRIRSRMKIGALQLIDIRTKEKAPIALQDDSIDISAVAGVIIENIFLSTYMLTVSETFKEKRPDAPDWELGTEEAVDTSYRTMLGGKNIEGVIDETADVKAAIKKFREGTDKFTIKSQLNEDIEMLSDSIAKAFGINISYLNTKEIILSEETKKKRRQLQDLAVDIRKQDLQTNLETKKIKTELRKKAQEKVKGDAAGLNLGSKIEKAAKTASVEPKQIVDLLALEKLSEANTTIFTTAGEDGKISLPAMGAMFGAGSEAGKKEKGKKKPPEKNENAEPKQE